jgi:hypothetical protein
MNAPQLRGGSSPFKGEARRGMGFLAIANKPHPHPNPPLQGEGAAPRFVRPLRKKAQR